MRRKSPQLMRAHFNLIEIALALGILSIGLLGTLGLFSVGLNSNRDAIGRNYSADSADEILHQLAATVKKDWARVEDLEEGTPPDMPTPGPLDSAWSSISESGNFYQQTVPDGIVYRMQQTSIAASSDSVVDFDAMVRIWRTPTEVWEYDSVARTWDSVIDEDYERGLMMNVEMSWPALVPFSVRQKAYFTMEVAKDDD